MDRPNIILLVVDCLRADRLGCYGAPGGLTPAIDRLAARGVVFEQAVAQGFHTLTAMSSVMSGCYPSTYGGFGSLSDQRPSLPRALQALGYTTAAFTPNPYLSPARGYHLGFNHFDECRPALSPSSTTPRGLLIRGLNRLVKRWGAGIECPPTLEAGAVTDRVLHWLERAPRPFFLWVHYMDAHTPYFLSRCSLALPGGRGQRPYPFGFWRHLRLETERVTPGELALAQELYDGGVRHIDTHLGRLLDHLGAHSPAGGVTTLVMADHGEEFIEHGFFGHSHSLYEPILRIPLVIAPGDDPATGRRVSAQVRQIDLAPTLVALAGGTPSPAMQGKDLAPALRGGPWPHDLPAISQTNPTEPWALSLRQPPWKLIWGLEPGTIQGRSLELYHLDNDPGERHNLAAEQPERVAAMLAILQQHAASLDLPSAGAVDDSLDPQVLARLQALGYVDGPS